MLSFTDLRKHMIVPSLIKDINSLPSGTLTVDGFNYTINRTTGGLQFQRSNINKDDRFIGMIPEWDSETYYKLRRKLDTILKVQNNGI